MNIARIDLFRVAYKLLEEYVMSKARVISLLHSHVVRIATDEGIKGYGEVVPLGPAYMDAFAGGVPAGISELGPILIGKDPRQLSVINDLMDANLGGHNYIKAPLDVACWDILGKATGMPVCALLGGQQVTSFPLYRAIPQRTDEGMVTLVKRYKSEGYKRFQLKVGGHPDDDIKRVTAVLQVLDRDDVLVADANTGWSLHEAIRVVNGLSGRNVYIEQPCATMEECCAVRRCTTLPMIIDELITGITPFLRAFEKGIMNVANIKISRVGGLTKARQLRDMCQSLGVAVTIEDCWGGDIMTSAISHLVGSTQPRVYFSSTDFNSYIDLHLAKNAPRREEGYLTVPSGTGLGIAIDEDLLGEPIVTIK